MFGVRLKKHLLVYSRFILWTDNGRYSEVNSGIQVVFTRPIIFYYSHKLYIQKDYFVFMIRPRPTWHFRAYS